MAPETVILGSSSCNVGSHCKAEYVEERLPGYWGVQLPIGSAPCGRHINCRNKLQELNGNIPDTSLIQRMLLAESLGNNVLVLAFATDTSGKKLRICIV